MEDEDYYSVLKEDEAVYFTANRHHAKQKLPDQPYYEEIATLETSQRKKNEAEGNIFKR